MKANRALLLLLAVAACQPRTAEKPVWLNPATVVAVPGTQLQFRSATSNWQATLFTFAQPIALPVVGQKAGFTVSLASTSGILEGTAQLCLSLDDQHFYYPITLKNSLPPADIRKDYRSPKTVNPDSSLHQQRILHTIDSYRNLLLLPGQLTYFQEEEISLSPRVGVYRAIKDEPMSAYYVQPGSCTSIPLQADYRPEAASYCVSAGPLIDRYNNRVANGTRLQFLYTDGQATYRIETTLLNGYATAMIPARKSVRYQVRAIAHNTTSNAINLTP